MSDFNSSLPVRTENNGDVVVKIGDGTSPSQFLAIDVAGKIIVKLDDASGNGITSQVNGAQRALDVGINVAGVQIDPRSIRALTSADVVTANQGAANTAANGWPMKITDGTSVAAVKAASTAAIATDPALVVAISPNNTVAVTQSTSPWITSDLSDGSVAPGTAGTKSSLGGLVFNSAAPTLTAGQQAAIQGDAAGNLKVNIAAGSLDVGIADKTAFTYGTTVFQPVGGVFQDTAPTLSAGTTGAARLTTNRALHANLRTAGGVEITAQSNGSQEALDVGINVLGVQIDPRQVRALTAADVVTSNQGTANTAANAWTVAPVVAGAAVSSTNPLPVIISNTLPGTPVNKYNTSVALAAGSSINHDYTITTGKTFNGKKFWAAGSGKIRMDAQTSPDGTAFTTFWTGFNSTAFPNVSVDLDLLTIIDTGTGSKMRIIITNLDKQSFDVYSTISGTEQ